MTKSSFLLNIFIWSILTSIIGCGSGSSSSSDNSSSVSSTNGKAGSQAKYAVVGDYLYTVNESVMDILDISDAYKPKKVSKIHLPWDVETLFAYKDYLYIGAESGVYIYDNSNPLMPISIANFSHVQSCDPVVVSDDIAYVTLNTASNCWNNRTDTNRLEILDVSSPTTPRLIKKVDMFAPTGLGIDGNRLFICDGEAGVKSFEVNKSNNSQEIEVYLDLKSSNVEIDCYDVIVDNGTLIVSNYDNIRQFDYGSSPKEEMVELGRIE